MVGWAARNVNFRLAAGGTGCPDLGPASRSGRWSDHGASRTPAASRSGVDPLLIFTKIFPLLTLVQFQPCSGLALEPRLRIFS